MDSETHDFTTKDELGTRSLSDMFNVYANVTEASQHRRRCLARLGFFRGISMVATDDRHKFYAGGFNLRSYNIRKGLRPAAMAGPASGSRLRA